MHKRVVFLAMVCVNVWGWDALQSTVQVAAQLNDPKLVIIDVSESDLYHKEGHIHGAYRTDISEWRVAKEKYFLLKTPDEIQKRLRSLGINSDTNVILYGHYGSAKDLLTSSYVYWAMKYNGIKNVAIMDGGLEAWKADKRFVTNDDPKAPEGNVTVQRIPEMVADLLYVKDNIGKVAMIDARASENYFGITASKGVERLGHISGAMSYFWTYSITPEFKLRPRDVLNKVFRDGFSLTSAQPIVVYCTGGLETSFNYFVLNGVLGYTNVRLYDASMREWGNRQDTPMVQYKWEEFHPVSEVVQ